MAYVVKNPKGKFVASAWDRRQRGVFSAALATQFAERAAAEDYAKQKHARDRTGGTWSVWDTDRLEMVFSVAGQGEH